MFAVLTGFAGVVLGSFLGFYFTERSARKARKFEFMKERLRDFYSPMAGIIRELREFGESRVEVSEASDQVWRQNIEDARQRGGVKEIQLEAERLQPILRGIDYNNQQLRNRLMPLYEEMLDLFRKHRHLTTDEVRKYYPTLVRFVDMWRRILHDATVHEVAQQLHHDEQELEPLYKLLQSEAEEIRECLFRGDVA